MLHVKPLLSRVVTMNLVLAAFATARLAAAAAQAPEAISLAGPWGFQLDPENRGEAEQWFTRAMPQSIRLPGSTAEHGYGDDPTVDTQWTAGVNEKSWYTSPRYAEYRRPGNVKLPFWLTPVKRYVGPAWYQRDVEIPAGWQGRHAVLFLERAHWETRVWLDGKPLGMQDSLSTPHEYDLGPAQPGKHRLAVRVDNTYKIDVGINAHSVSDHTQSNWNGIVGRIELRPRPAVWIDDVQVYPDAAGKSVRVRVRIGNATGKPSGIGKLLVRSEGPLGADGPFMPLRGMEIDVPESGATCEMDYALGDDVRLWDEFHPALYRLRVETNVTAGDRNVHDEKDVAFGMRQIAAEGRQLKLNGRPVMLRGTLECCIFPLTGYPPTDVEAWKRVIGVCKAFGLNHIRFHSHCPPEAAFTAADELGFYFQVEGPFWTAVGAKPETDRYVDAETERILRCYGNHPSFLLMAHGNEPGGPGRGAKFLGPWVERCKQKDDRRLFTCGSGWPYIPQNQYHVMHRPLRLHGRLGLSEPQTTLDYRDVVENNAVPLVSHEPGQWCVFPNLDEIAKYTGVLKAKNFEIVRDFLEQKGMLDQAKDFLTASGKFQALCYKQEIETFLRTPGLGGFQLLDLHDFPGQGTALVGVLDPFWDEKGYLTAAQHRRYCGAVVPLARMAKRVWTNDEQFVAAVEVSQFGSEDLRGATVAWSLAGPAGRSIAAGQWQDVELPRGRLSPVGEIRQPLGGLDAAGAMKLTVSIPGTPYANDWDVWVYPRSVDAAVPAGIRLVRRLDEAAVEHLRTGGKVLLMPRVEEVAGDTQGTFEPIFWNRLWFPRQKNHTLGILCDPRHPALAAFPTDSHSNWQWYDLAVRGKPIVMDDLPRELRPIVQVIDDWNTCRKLGLVFEARAAGGRLLVCAIDLEDRLDARPVARQLRRSLLDYMAGERFQPRQELTLEQVRWLTSVPPDSP